MTKKEKKVFKDLFGHVEEVKVKASDNYKALIFRFLKKDSKVNFPLEVKVAKTLIEKYTFDFLINFELDFKLNSLAFFLTPKGKEMLRYQKKIINLELCKPLEYHIGETKIGENTEVKRVKSLKDFIN